MNLAAELGAAYLLVGVGFAVTWARVRRRRPGAPGWPVIDEVVPGGWPVWLALNVLAWPAVGAAAWWVDRR